MAAVVAHDGELLLLLLHGIGIVVNLAELLLYRHTALLRADHDAGLTVAAAHREDEANPDGDKDHPAHQHIQVDIRQILDLPEHHAPLIIGKEQRHKAKVLPEGRRLPLPQQLLSHEELAEQPYHPREADQHQAEIAEKVQTDKIGRLHPDLLQEQDGRRVEKDHVDGLQPEHEEMVEPKRAYREHQQQEVRPVADEVEFLEGVFLYRRMAQNEERCDEQELSRKDDEMTDDQDALLARRRDDPERIVAQIGHRQQ